MAEGKEFPLRFYSPPGDRGRVSLPVRQAARWATSQPLCCLLLKINVISISERRELSQRGEGICWRRPAREHGQSPRLRGVPRVQLSLAPNLGCPVESECLVSYKNHMPPLHIPSWKTSGFRYPRCRSRARQPNVSISPMV